MIFELGKAYIVDVTEKGIMPLIEFDENRWVDKDHDDLDFLTDEEKKVIINDVLNKIKAEIQDTGAYEQEVHGKTEFVEGITYCLNIINKYNEAALGTGIKNLEQEHVLDKLRTEIEQRHYEVANDSVLQGMKYEREAILEIIDKYKTVS